MTQDQDPLNIDYMYLSTNKNYVHPNLKLVHTKLRHKN